MLIATGFLLSHAWCNRSLPLEWEHCSRTAPHASTPVPAFYSDHTKAHKTEIQKTVLVRNPNLSGIQTQGSTPVYGQSRFWTLGISLDHLYNRLKRILKYKRYRLVQPYMTLHEKVSKNQTDAIWILDKSRFWTLTVFIS